MLKTSPEGIQKKAWQFIGMVHWKLSEKLNLEKSEKWYLHNPQTVSENVNHKLIWDMNIQCENAIVERTQSLVVSGLRSETKDSRFECGC